MRGALLLLGAGLVALGVAGRLRAAVHPGEVSDPRIDAAFAQACRKLPVLRSLRVHTDAPDAAPRLRALVPVSDRAIASVTDVDEMVAAARLGTLAAWDVHRLRGLRRALENGAAPFDLPPAPDVAPLFHDALGRFDFELMLRDDAAVAMVRHELPDATLTGEPVLRAEEERLRPWIVRATLLALVAVTALLLWRRPPDALARLVAVVGAVVLLAATRLGIDAWTPAALALVATSRSGAPLWAGVACLLSPVLTLQRMGVVLVAGAALRLRRPVARKRMRPAPAIALVVLAGAVAWFASFDAAFRRGFPGPATEPVATMRGEPEPAPTPAAQRELNRIHDLATDPRVAEAARYTGARPRGLRQRRETVDGEPVTWDEPLTYAKGRWRTSWSHEGFRAAGTAAVDASNEPAAFALLGLVVLLVLRGGVPPRRALAAVIVPALALTFLPYPCAPALPLLVIACFGAEWTFAVAVLAAGAMLGVSFLAAFAPLLLAPIQSLISISESGPSSSSGE